MEGPVEGLLVEGLEGCLMEGLVEGPLVDVLVDCLVQGLVDGLVESSVEGLVHGLDGLMEDQRVGLLVRGHAQGRFAEDQAFVGFGQGVIVLHQGLNCREE